MAAIQFSADAVIICETKYQKWQILPLKQYSINNFP